MSESPRKSKWLGVALAASLAVNVFVLGAVAARVIWHHHSERFDRVFLGPATEDLSKEGRERLRATMKGHRQEVGAIFRQVRTSFERSKDILAAPEFDQAAYAKALSDVRAHSDAAQAAIHGAFIEAVKGLSQEDRETLAKAGISPFPPPRAKHKNRPDR